MKEHLPAEFNAALYRWEQRYFFKQLPRPLFQDQRVKTQGAGSSSQFARNRKTPCKFAKGFGSPRFSIAKYHYPERQAKLIDFQGMRPGLAEYDLASLLFDPYVELSAAERSELTGYYRQKQTENGRRVNGNSTTHCNYARCNA